MYHTTPQNVGQHLKVIESSGELYFSSKRKKFFTLDESGGQVAKVPIYHYNLDEIIALGYKIDSPIAIRFRKWATERLHEYIVKGFTMDDERLKQGWNRCLKRVASGDRVVRRLCGAMDEKH